MFLGLFSLLLSLAQPALAQSADLTTNYYRYRDQYQQNYSVYQEKKQVDIQYHSLATQKDLITSAKNAIIARNNLLKSYLAIIRQQLESSKSSAPDQTTRIQQSILAWEDWLSTQNSLVSGFSNTDDFTNNQSIFQENYPKIQKAISLGSTQNQINALNLGVTLTKQLIADLQSDSKFKPEGQNWLSDINLALSSAIADIQSASSIVVQIQDDPLYIGSNSTATNHLSKAQASLQAVANNLKTTVVKFYQP